MNPYITSYYIDPIYRINNKLTIDSNPKVNIANPIDITYTNRKIKVYIKFPLNNGTKKLNIDAV